MWLRRGDTGIRFASAWSGTGALPANLGRVFGRLDCVARRLGCPVDAPVLRGTVAFIGHAPGTGASRPAVRR